MKKGKNKTIIYLLMLVTLLFTLTGCQKKDASQTASSLEFANLLGNGINLGNTMEAYGHLDLGINAGVTSYETFWGQPVTTKEMIDTMKANGFDTLRIPVAWTNTMDYENGDYTINENYLNRVEEIINYALSSDMYVIVNDHWDGGWWGMFGSATQKTREDAMNMYISMWTQIAEKYKDYSNRLVFESANEELGNRLNDTDICSDSGALSEDDCYEMTNKINQAFVDTIRSTGGNNKKRFLLIAGYNTDIAMTCDDRFMMPSDSAKDKLLLSVHYYTPSGYCINTSLSSWGSAKNYNEQNTLLSMMTKFTDQGYGIVIGEYAVALNSDGSVKDHTIDFYNNFLNNCDLYGYSPMLWDCSSLFIRKDLSFIDQDIADLFKNRNFTIQSSMTKEEKTTQAQAAIDTSLTAATEVDAAFAKENALPDNQSVAWIMFNSSDWNVINNVGDAYDSTAKTDGVIATDVPVTGAGTYTVSIDFTGTDAGLANSTVFSALAIANGELLYPGFVITITDVQINGEPYTLTGNPYTTSDDKKCTRLNLYNEWVTSIPKEARIANGNIANVSPSVLDAATLGDVKTISITFDYGPSK